MKTLTSTGIPTLSILLGLHLLGVSSHVRAEVVVSTTTTTTTTTVATTTTTTQAPNVPLGLSKGWNLVGNGTTTPIDVPATLGDGTTFVTVWKWIAAQSKWAFYAPALVGQALTDYAANKGYEVLTTIHPGEGFWVNAKQAGSMAYPAGQAVSIASLSPGLIKGWNLAALGESATPKQFCDAQSTGVTTLWAWDVTSSAWYFYAPSLNTSGGLPAYIQGKGYLDFTANNKALGLGMGFWVNRP